MAWLVLGAIILLVFGQTLGHEFLTWDDDLHITANPAFNPLGWSNLLWFWRAPYENLYIPVSYSVLAAEVALTDLLFPRDANGQLTSALVFRSMSLLLHWLCCNFTFMLLRRFAVSWNGALVGTLLFALHPLQVESVAWTSETRGLLGTAFGLAALWCHRRSQEPGRRKAWRVAALMGLVLALLSKPSTAAVVLIAVAFETIWLQRPWQKVETTAVVGGGVVIAVGLLTRMLQPTGMTTAALPDWFRPVVAADALGWYLGKLFWPASLAMDYGRSPHALWSRSGDLWIGLMPFVLLGVLYILKVERRIWLAVALFGAGLVPVLGLVPFGFQEISTVADRYIYVAMLGPAVAIAVIWDRWRLPIARGAVVTVLGLFGYLAFNDSKVWRDSETLYAHALEVTPQSWIALHNQASLIAKRGDYDAAIGQFRRVIEMRPQFGRAWQNLSVCLLAKGETKEAIQALRQAVICEPGNAHFRVALAQCLAASQQRQDADHEFQVALKLAPDDAQLLNEIGQWFANTGRQESAMEAFSQAAIIAPNHWQARVQFALQLQSRGDIKSAIHELQLLIASQPQHPEIRFHYALALARGGQHQESATELAEVRKVTQTQSKLDLREAATRELVVVRNILGSHALAQRQWSQAEHEFRLVIDLDPKFAAGHFNLGRALSAQSAITAARKSFSQALSLLPPGSPEARDVEELISKLPSQQAQASQSP